MVESKAMLSSCGCWLGQNSEYHGSEQMRACMLSESVSGHFLGSLCFFWLTVDLV